MINSEEFNKKVEKNVERDLKVINFTAYKKFKTEQRNRRIKKAITNGIKKVCDKMSW